MRKFVPKISQIDKRLEDRISLGLSLLKELRVDEALKEFERVLETAPEMTLVRLQVGNILLRRKQYRLALQSFQQALKEDPFTLPALLAIGQILLKSGDLDKAYEFFQSVLALDPFAEWAYIGSVEVLYRNQNYPKAIETCQLAILKNPKVAAHYFQLALVLYGQKDIDGAISALGKAITLEPGLAHAHAYLSRIYADVKNFDSAQDAFYRALDSNPLIMKLQPQLQLDFIKILLENNQLDDIEIMLDEIPDFTNLSQRRYRLQGDYCMLKGNYQKAVESYRMALMLRTVQEGTALSIADGHRQGKQGTSSDWQSQAEAYLSDLTDQSNVVEESLSNSVISWL